MAESFPSILCADDDADRAGGVEGVLHPQGLHRPHGEQWRRGLPAGEAVGAARRHPRPAHPAPRRPRRPGADPRHRPRIARDHDDRHGRGARDGGGRGAERGGRLRQAARPRRHREGPGAGRRRPARRAGPAARGPARPRGGRREQVQGRARRVPRRQGLRGARGGQRRGRRRAGRGVRPAHRPARPDDGGHGRPRGAPRDQDRRAPDLRDHGDGPGRPRHGAGRARAGRGGLPHQAIPVPVPRRGARRPPAASTRSRRARSAALQRSSNPRAASSPERTQSAMPTPR